MASSNVSQPIKNKAMTINKIFAHVDSYWRENHKIQIP